MSDNHCKWHEVPVKDCLSCNNTESNVFYIKDKEKSQTLFGNLPDGYIITSNFKNEIDYLNWLNGNWEKKDESN